MVRHRLNEDLFADIPDVEYQLDTNIELDGPDHGEDVGVSGLLLDLIGDIAHNINNYNQMELNLENYPEIAELIKDFADEENIKLGKIQSALKTISPNAEYIMNGAVEAEQELDPGSPLGESLNEDFSADDIMDIIDLTTQAKILNDKRYELCKKLFDIDIVSILNSAEAKSRSNEAAFKKLHLILDDFVSARDSLKDSL